MIKINSPKIMMFQFSQIYTNVDSPENNNTYAILLHQSNLPSIAMLRIGVLYDDGTINNEASTERLAEVAAAYAKAGMV